VVVGEPGGAGATRGDQRDREHNVGRRIHRRPGYLPPLKVVGVASVLNNERVAVIDQQQKHVNVETIVIDMANVNCRR
jgi:hypothetical protein